MGSVWVDGEWSSCCECRGVEMSPDHLLVEVRKEVGGNETQDVINEMAMSEIYFFFGGANFPNL